MLRRKSTTGPIFRHVIGGVLVALAVSVSGGADDPHRHDPVDIHAGHETHAEAAGAQGEAFFSEQLESAVELARRGQNWLSAWYRETPPADRVTWAGMMASAGLALGVLFERMVRLQKHKIVPPDFTARFLDRLHEGKLDCGQALDHCELNPSPAAQVALAAVRRWGRPPADLERAVALAHPRRKRALRRNVGTLRRIAAITPLLGLLGTLFAVGRALEGMPSAPITSSMRLSHPRPGQDAQAAPIAWGPTLAAALTPLSVGIIIAALALVDVRRFAHAHRKAGRRARPSRCGDHRRHRSDRACLVPAHRARARRDASVPFDDGSGSRAVIDAGADPASATDAKSSPKRFVDPVLREPGSGLLTKKRLDHC